MKKPLNDDIKDILSELVGDYIQPSLQDLPFSTPEEVVEALRYLAEDIENIDAQEVFENLTVDADEVLLTDLSEIEEEN